MNFGSGAWRLGWSLPQITSKSCVKKLETYGTCLAFLILAIVRGRCYTYYTNEKPDAQGHEVFCS